MERIVIRVKKGQVTIKPEGFSGPSCLEATRNLERLLGSKVSDSPTDEMYRETVQHEEQTQ